MARTIRYHLDEHVPAAVADGLRRRGIDVTTTTDAGLKSADDLDHLLFGLTQRRVVVTHDHHFLVMHNSGQEHCGIAYCHPQARTIGEIIRALELIWQILDPEEMRGEVEFL